MKDTFSKDVRETIKILDDEEKNALKLKGEQTFEENDEWYLSTIDYKIDEHRKSLVKELEEQKYWKKQGHIGNTKLMKQRINHTLRLLKNLIDKKKRLIKRLIEIEKVEEKLIKIELKEEALT